ncbi:hypothetical protein T09_13591 [Trichinella sp. T9]|nr:hypothetical protein T09_13591 [Trichinella sp. T9]
MCTCMRIINSLYKVLRLVENVHHYDEETIIIDKCLNKLLVIFRIQLTSKKAEYLHFSVKPVSMHRLVLARSKGGWNQSKNQGRRLLKVSGWSQGQRRGNFCQPVKMRAESTRE